MTLNAQNVIDLQFFLMDAAKRYAVARADGRASAGAVLASAAALDYPLFVVSEHPKETLDETGAVAAAIRETLTRAALSALAVIERVRDAPDDAFEDFVVRHVRKGGIFDVLRALRAQHVIASDDVAFRVLAVANDIAERRYRER